MPTRTSREAFLLALGARVVPDSTKLDEAGRDRFLAIIQHAVSQRPPSVQRQLSLFLFVLRWLPVLRYFGRLDKLAPGKQDAFLGFLQAAPLTLLRKGFWGLKTLLFMGYYGQVEVHASIGYAVQRQNANEKLRA